MSQTPDARQDGAEYEAGWDAVMRLVEGGKSWSGNEANCVFLNSRGERFADVSAASGLNFTDDGRALGIVDWDHDGDLDLWMRNRTAPRLRLMLNQSNPAPQSFVALRLRGKTVNRDAIGARAEVRLKGGAAGRLVRTLYAGDGFRSQSSKWLHFGLGPAAEIDEVVVRWPGGASERFSGVAPGGRYVLEQGSGRATGWTPPRRGVALAASEQLVAPPTQAARVVLSHRLPPLALPYQPWDGSPPRRIDTGGRPLLVNLWASWCAPCVNELRELTAQRDRLEAAGIDVLALTVEGLDPESETRPDDARSMLGQLGYPFRSGVATAELLDKLHAVQESLFTRVPAFAVPLSVLLDDAGRLAVVYRGPVDVDRLLADRAVLALSGEALRDAALPQAGRWYAPFQPTGALLPALARGFVERRPQDALSLLRGALDHELAEGRRAATAEERQRHTAGLAQIYFLVAKSLANLGRFPQAIEQYLRSLQLDPNDADVHEGLGVALSTIGRLDDAMQHFMQALEISPDDPEVHNNLGLVYHLRGELPRALAHYRESVRINPHDDQVHYNLGQALRMSGRREEALAELREALRINPDSLGALGDVAWALATDPDAAGDRLAADEALTLARRAAQLTDQRDATIMDTLAAAYANASQFDRAVATAQLALELARQAGNRELAHFVGLRLELYRQRRPYRESIPPPPGATRPGAD